MFGLMAVKHALVTVFHLSNEFRLARGWLAHVEGESPVLDEALHEYRDCDRGREAEVLGGAIELALEVDVDAIAQRNSCI